MDWIFTFLIIIAIAFAACLAVSLICYIAMSDESNQAMLSYRQDVSDLPVRESIQLILFNETKRNNKNLSLVRPIAEKSGENYLIGYFVRYSSQPRSSCAENVFFIIDRVEDVSDVHEKLLELEKVLSFAATKNDFRKEAAVIFE